eukprot:99970-Chlamydomonas_euryale.AAC.2
MARAVPEGAPGGGVSAALHSEKLGLEPPTLLAPRRMWTGKQVISTVVRHFTRGMAPLTFTGKAKVWRCGVG